MKVKLSKQINPFGGINFVQESFDDLGFDKILEDHLPSLAAQCKYDWKDIIYSLFSIYFCGGDCIEDIGTHLKSKINNTPFCQVPSPDRLLDRLKELAQVPIKFKSQRGGLEHLLCSNSILANLNIAVLKKIGALDAEELTIDYDNTIIPTEKSDCKAAYKSGLAYQPGIATINIDHILYLENRNGNAAAKSDQRGTIERLLGFLAQNGITSIQNFRADAASYQEDVFTILQNHVENIYISAPPTCVKSCFTQIEEWKPYSDGKGGEWLIGETTYTPFKKRIKAAERCEKLKTYRVVVKKQLKKNRQIDMETMEAYRYHVIVTNNQEKTIEEVLHFYHQRGAMEKQFDIMKNDFGWSNLPFSKMDQNNVFLNFMAVCKNLYQYIITQFSQTFEHLTPTMRIKKFIFRFIAIPAKWIKHSGQRILHIFGPLAFKT